MARLPRLVTISFSHYSELARWSLDACGIAFQEKACLPMTHMVSAAIATRGGRIAGSKPSADRVSTKYSLPLLVVPAGFSSGSKVSDDTAVVHGSREIAMWACQHHEQQRQHDDSRHRQNYPGLLARSSSPQAVELMGLFHDRLGPWVRLLAYYHMMKPEHADLFPSLVAQDKSVGAMERAVFTTAFPLAKSFIVNGLKVNEKRALRAEQNIDEVFDRVDDLLADGRSFLLDDDVDKGPEPHAGGPTMADLSFAAMAAPALFVGPSEGLTLSCPMPTMDDLPELAEKAIAWRARPAGKHVLNLFQHHRQQPW
eukprot:m.20549 g.20549  ORF g.20549 m.20549 type:complete len:312 (+) comp6197_c1_seq1:62-997(+)